MMHVHVMYRQSLYGAPSLPEYSFAAGTSLVLRPYYCILPSLASLTLERSGNETKQEHGYIKWRMRWVRDTSIYEYRGE